MISACDQTANYSQRVLILAPTGKDAQVLHAALSESGITARICESEQDLCSCIREGAGTAVIAGEALTGGETSGLAACLSGQPEWSDFPLVIMAVRGRDLKPAWYSLGRNVSHSILLERPVYNRALINAVRSSLRSRNRQYQVRDELEQRRKAEAARQASEQRWRAMFETSRDFLAVAREDGTVLWANPACTESLGFTSHSDEILFSRIHPDDRDRVTGKWKSMIRGKETFNDIQYRFLTDGDAHIHLRTHARKISVDGESYVYVSSHDITDSKKAEKVLRRSRDDLQKQVVEAQKMESVGRLAAGIAHDFNNLVQIVRGWTDRMLRQTRDRDPLRPGLRMIREAAQKASGLTRQLLAFGRKQIMEPEVFDLGNAVENMTPMIGRLLSEEIIIDCCCPSSPVYVNADPGQIEQVVMNLAVNAKDAMPGGGTLTIEVHPEPCDPADPDREYAELIVSDTGTGMDPETQSRIFDPFFTTKPAGQGTGLGLSTTYGIVKQSGGEIEVESEPDRGTSFYIFLPKAHTPEPKQAEPEDTSVQKKEGKVTGTVLFVEDEEMLRSVIAEEMTAFGLTVIPAGSYEEAVRVCGEYADGIDIVATDMILPDRNGSEVARAVLSSHPDARILYMSGFSQTHLEMDRSIPEGVFIEKPFGVDDLNRTIQHMLEKNTQYRGP